MPLTTTTHLTAFTRPLPDACTFAFSPPSTPLAPTTITFHRSSSITTQLHWHTTHTEYLKILSGAALVSISGHSRIALPSDGILEVPRYARHEWMRFDRPAHLLSTEQRGVQELWMRDRGEEEVGRLGEGDLVVEEWTEPADGEKEVFFRNLFSTFQEPGYETGWMGLGELWKMVQVMVVMWGLDNFVVLVDCEGWKGGWRGVVESGITYGVMGGMNFVGRAVGCRAVNEEYTPARLVRRWEGGKVE